MAKKHGRRPKALCPPPLPKPRVATKDVGCSPVSELLSSELTLPELEIVELNESETKTAKMEFIATRVDGVVSVAAHRLEIGLSPANLNWKAIFTMSADEKLLFNMRIDGKIWANQWRVLASIEWIFSDPNDISKRGVRFVCAAPNSTRFDSDAHSWHWTVSDRYWRSLVTNPEADGQTVRTVLDLEFVLTIDEIFGFRLCHKFSYNFTVPNKDADLVLHFSDGPLYIDCNFLSYHSAYFRATKERLSNMKRDENGFPSENMDVNMKEFIELVEIVYPSEREITDDNISFILALADRFLFDGVLKKCEKFLMSGSFKIDTFTKIYWASEYIMTDLQDWCFSQFKSRKELNLVQKSEVFNKMKKSANVMTSLWEKLASLPE